MAGENELNCSANTAASKPNNEPHENSGESSNDVELIDLSNDDEESKEVECLDDNLTKDLENGDNEPVVDNDNDEDDDEDDDEEEDDESMNNVNGTMDNNVQQSESASLGVKVADSEDEEEDEDEIMISDGEGESESLLLDNNDETSQTKSENSFINSHEIQNQKLSVQQQQQPTQQQKQNNDVKEEIIIDDDDEVQDLSTKSQTSIEDFIPKLSEELIGFPTFFKGIITIGDSIAINKKSRSDIDNDIRKDYSILDCPSQVVPLIMKKSNKFPPKLKQEENNVKPINPPAAPNNQNTKNMLTISDFYSSSVGKFLLGVGLSRVKQWYHKDAINKVRKQIRKEGEAEDLMEELKKQQEYLNSCRVANASYIFPVEKCEHCEFRSEFKLVLNQHFAYPHTTSRKEFKCNYCQFSSRDSKVIVDHVNFMHEKKCLIELPPQLYECPICPYESGVKSKAATHIAKCLRYFIPEKLLITKDDYFPTITPKPITQEDIKIYEATLQALRFAALNPQTKVPQIAGLPPGLQQQMYMVQQQQLTRIAPGRTKKQNFEPTMNKGRPSNSFLNQMNLKNVTTPQLYQMLSNAPGTQLLPNAPSFSGLANNALSLINKSQMIAKLSHNLPTPQPNRNSLPVNNVVNNKSNVISKQPNNLSVSSRMDGNPKGSFVMCEICDGYIKDLDQLRTHMHWIHKVRIHPKMLASRPPLNCQKCQWRFFTDQGLERHLLGAHGLVTSNMQDMVNQSQDGGRCTICGRVFTSKLVTHMNQAHKINLKPAHLSYKCTVCSATFNLYRLFENHVYMVHSGSVKRHTSDDANQPPRKKTALDLAAANGN